MESYQWDGLALDEVGWGKLQLLAVVAAKLIQELLIRYIEKKVSL